MPITYALFAKKKLNQVVMVGSHDAGITKGNWNTKTQNLNIAEQALAGARFFDVRVAAFKDKDAAGQLKHGVDLRTYHDDTKIELKQGVKWVNDLNTIRDVVRHKTLLGAKGEKLSDMMTQAKKYVEDIAPTEFLIFKFDKSTNPSIIVEMCRMILDGALYTCKNGGGNLNEKTLSDLQGKVILLFDNDGWQNCGVSKGKESENGVLRWKNLYATKSGYADRFDGLQYYGKGGVSAGAWTNPGKIKKNATAQTSLMQGIRLDDGTQDNVNPEVMGLMYWTTTGASMAGIKRRNEKMWGNSGLGKLRAALPNQQLLGNVAQFANDTAPRTLNRSSASSGPVLKRFMPNIVMVDFVCERTSQIIQQMNTIGGTELQAAVGQLNII